MVAVGRLEALRQALDTELGRERELLVAVDGGYTNRTVFRKAPAGVTLIGRVRKDAALYAPPEPASGRGRPRCYGRPLPTPEQIRQEEATPWRRVRVYAAGRLHRLKVKVVGPVRWKGAGAKDLLLLVVQPLRYRPCRGHRLLYRDPAYLLCSNPTLPLPQVLQAYLWRWEVEVSFREEKSLLGMGEAQVRTEPAVAKLPAFVAAMYGMLHVAAGQVPQLPRLARPCWQRPQPQARVTTAQLQAMLRAELWGRALGVIFEGFVSAPAASTKPLKITSPLAAAVLYAQR